MVNNESKVKAMLAISFFFISMIIVGTISYEYGRQDGYREGYADADQDWRDYLNNVWDGFVDAVYLEGYAAGFNEGYLWGYVEGWLAYGADQIFQHPHGGPIP